MRKLTKIQTEKINNAPEHLFKNLPGQTPEEAQDMDLAAAEEHHHLQLRNAKSTDKNLTEEQKLYLRLEVLKKRLAKTEDEIQTIELELATEKFT